MEKAGAERAELDRLIKARCEEEAREFAREKNYISWQPSFFEEVRQRFGFSKRKQTEFFLPVYNCECNLFVLFNTECGGAGSGSTSSPGNVKECADSEATS